MSRLPDATRIGAVELAALDVPRVTSFYRDLMGLPESAIRVVRASAPRPAFATGLYHTAFVHPSRAHLARAVRRLLAARHPIEGASDHLVSEAIYLSDPEGNGIEIYSDRPRETWRRAGDSIEMGTRPLDAEGLLAEPDPANEEAARVGHVHLKVADVAAAEAFYRDLIGFDVQAHMGNMASFVSAGGYHHHVGMNSWESRGAPAPPEGAAGLRHFEILVPTREAANAVASRLAEAKHLHERAPDGSILTRDPSGNGLVVRATDT